jgi:hypothetical protein
MNRWLWVWAWAALLLSAGCEITSFSLTSPPERGTALSRRLWAGEFHKRWDGYGEYFLSCGSHGHCFSGYDHSYSYAGAKLRKGRRNDLLRAIRTDLLEFAADSGVTVRRPIRDNGSDGFEFDYAQGRNTGKVRVEIKPGEKEGTVDVICTITEPARED